MATAAAAAAAASWLPSTALSTLRCGASKAATPFVWYNGAAARHPARVGIATAFVKTFAADAFAQKVLEGNDSFDFRRNATFSIFGLVYLGCWQYYLYNNIFRRMCGSITAAVGHVGSAPVKVFLDQAVHHPLMYFPTFYMLKGSMEGRSMSDSIQQSMQDMPENLKACWAVWVPAQLINFSVVPHHLHVPFVSGVSFLWCIILSGLRGQSSKQSGQECAGLEDSKRRVNVPCPLGSSD